MGFPRGGEHPLGRERVSNPVHDFKLIKESILVEKKTLATASRALLAGNQNSISAGTRGTLAGENG